jgi:hypothetical protein
MGPAPKPLHPWLFNVLGFTQPERSIIDYAVEALQNIEIPLTVSESDQRQWAIHCSNVFRWHKLYFEGGTYLDMNVVPLAELPYDNWIASHRTVCTSAISLQPCHPLAERVIDAIYNVKGRSRLATYASGEELVAYVFKNTPGPHVREVPLYFGHDGRVIDSRSPLVHLYG